MVISTPVITSAPISASGLPGADSPAAELHERRAAAADHRDKAGHRDAGDLPPGLRRVLQDHAGGEQLLRPFGALELGLADQPHRPRAHEVQGAEPEGEAAEQHGKHDRDRLEGGHHRKRLVDGQHQHGHDQRADPARRRGLGAVAHAQRGNDDPAQPEARGERRDDHHAGDDQGDRAAGPATWPRRWPIPGNGPARRAAPAPRRARRRPAPRPARRRRIRPR